MKNKLYYYWNLLLIWLGVRDAPILKKLDSVVDYAKKKATKATTNTDTWREHGKLCQRITYYKWTRVAAAFNKAGQIIRAGYVVQKPYASRIIRHKQ